MAFSSTDRPSVSVLIDNFNYGRFLPAALEGALAQSYPVAEILIADDGSTDDSCEVAGSYAARYPRIKALRKANGGQASAFNTAFAASTGDIVCLLDSDDVWKPDKVSQVVEQFAAWPQAGWVRHKMSCADEALKPLGKAVPAFRGSRRIGNNRYAHVEKTLTFTTSAVSLRRGLASVLFPIPERPFRKGPDLYLDFMCGVLGAPGFSLDEELGFYRCHTAQMSKGAGNFRSMVEGEIAMTRAFLSLDACQGYVPTHLYKHEMVAAYLNSGRVLDRQRLRLCASGLASVRRLVTAGQTRLALLQTAKLLYGFLLPRSWIRRQLRLNAWSAA